MRLIRLTVSYSVQEVAELFQLHKSAVLRWIKEGLQIIDQRKPYLIYGSHLVDFLKLKQNRRKHKCKENELYCCKCRQPRQAILGSISIEQRNVHRLKIKGLCVVCKTSIYKDASAKKYDELLKIFIANRQLELHIIESNDFSINSNISEGGIVETTER